MAEPHGPGNLVENDEVIYAEKFCVPAHQGVQCQEDEIFILHVQKKIRSETIRSVPSNSIAACLKACLNTKKCRSSSFDSNKGECFLHKTSIADNSEKLEESDAGWVLIENGCSATKRRHPSSFKRPLQLTKFNEIKKQTTTKSISEWSDWSECRYKLGSAQRVRVRTRNCEEQCPNAGMQIMKC
uniref:Apple domain-containing protein n=1 Tax=Ditylenchus dipsaci TaxID=166011 RepID=A0A915ET02_9BILA